MTAADGKKSRTERKLKGIPVGDSIGECTDLWVTDDATYFVTVQFIS